MKLIARFFALLGCLFWVMLAVIILIVYLTTEWAVEARVYFAHNNLFDNITPLEVFYKTHDRLPNSLDEFIDFDRNSKWEPFWGKPSYQGRKFPHTRIFMDTYFSANFLDNFVKLENLPLICDFSDSCFHDENWIIMTYYIPFNRKQSVLYYTGNPEQLFYNKMIPTAAFKKQLKKQNLTIPKTIFHVKKTNTVILFQSIIVLLVSFKYYMKFLKFAFRRKPDPDTEGSEEVRGPKDIS